MPSERRRAPVARHMVCSATPGSEDVGPNRKSRFESFILPASKREIILAESTRTADTEGEEDGEHKERRSRPWWLCGRRRLGERLQDPEERRLTPLPRPETHPLPSEGRRQNPPQSGRPGRGGGCTRALPLRCRGGPSADPTARWRVRGPPPS